MRFRQVFWVVMLSFYLSGCVSTAMTGSTIYDIYAVSVDERGLYTLAKDKRIKLEIQAKIADEKFSKLLDVGVDSFYAKVLLVGEYESEKERRRLIRIAEQTEGVREVKAHLLPVKKTACSTASNLTLLSKVKARLFDDAKVWGTDVHVYTVQCHVVLAGIVQTKMERDRAIALAKQTNGARSVTSYIRAFD